MLLWAIFQRVSFYSLQSLLRCNDTIVSFIIINKTDMMQCINSISVIVTLKNSTRPKEMFEADFIVLKR